MTNVYEVCGTYQAAAGPAAFPIDIIEAADPFEALEIVARRGAAAAMEPHSETVPRPVPQDRP